MEPSIWAFSVTEPSLTELWLGASLLLLIALLAFLSHLCTAARIRRR